MSEHGARGGPRTSSGAPTGGGAGRRPVGPPSRSHPSPAVYRRRRLAVLLLALVVLAGLVAVLAFVWPGFARSDAAASPAPAVTATSTPTPEPPSTPTITPSARPEDATAFEVALPDEVGRFALVAESDSRAFDAADPNEAYALTYADGDAAGAARITLDAGQWLDEGTAGTAYDTASKELRAAAGAPVEHGDVTVDEAVTGSYARFDDGATSTVLWRNGTAVLRATGPAAEMESFYVRFPF